VAARLAEEPPPMFATTVAELRKDRERLRGGA
jgi:hypothetical protein